MDNNNNIDTIIGINVTIKGNLYNKGSIQVNGNVEGEVKSDENILVGETATIKGPVIAKKIEVSGEVKGLVEAHEKLEINPTGRVTGDINAKSLIIKEGAVFVGKSIMTNGGAQAAETKPAKEDKEIEPEMKEIVETEEVKEEDQKEEDRKTESSDKFGFFSKK